MATGTVQGFRMTRVVTTADTLVEAGPAYVVARLSAGAAAATLKIYNGTTAAANQVAILNAAANSADELGIPVRCQDGVKVQLSVNSAFGFVGIR